MADLTNATDGVTFDMITDRQSTRRKGPSVSVRSMSYRNILLVGEVKLTVQYLQQSSSSLPSEHCQTPLQRW